VQALLLPGAPPWPSRPGPRWRAGAPRNRRRCRRFCCPARLRAAGIRFCYRVRPEPCSGFV